ncbi:MAG: hypothetical protein KA515_02880 [Candidatus Pacebacteria bacterium]|nr:hypothetical protein [Candidatus Paceibacterota bacterium]
MDSELQKKIESLEMKVDLVYKSVEKTRRYFLIVAWVSILAIILPLIGLVFALPAFMTSYTSALDGIGI